MTKPVGIEKLTKSNHTLYARVQHLVRLKWEWEDIAADVDIPNVQALCQWVLDYREPKADVYRNAGHIHTVPVKVDYNPTPEKMSEQFIAWKRARDGAALTRSENALNDL